MFSKLFFIIRHYNDYAYFIELGKSIDRYFIIQLRFGSVKTSLDYFGFVRMFGIYNASFICLKAWNSNTKNPKFLLDGHIVTFVWR